MIRTPRPYSTRWLENSGAFFGCPDCGRPLSRLEGSAAARNSDVPSDRLPDPAGLVHRRLTPELGGTAREELPVDLAAVVRRVAVDHGLAMKEGLTPAEAGTEVPAVCLNWLGQPWLTLVTRPDGVTVEQIDRIENLILETAPIEALVRIEMREEPEGPRPEMILRPGSGRV